MSKKIYIHIGLPKAASTTIQNYFVENSYELLKLGVLYPHTGRRHWAHDDIGFQVVEDPRYNPAVGDLSALKEEISRAQVDKVVISSNQCLMPKFHRLNSPRMKISSLGETKIILYIRRQDLWLQSLWAQRVKAGFMVDPFEIFIDKAITQKIDPQDPRSSFSVPRSNADFYARVIRWEEVFGKKNIVVKILEKQAIQKHVFLDFLDILGVDLPNFVVLENKNISPGCQTLEVIRYIIGKIGRSELGPYPSLSPTYLPTSIRNYTATNHWDSEKFNGISKEIYQRLILLIPIRMPSLHNLILTGKYYSRIPSKSGPSQHLRWKI